MAARPLYMYLFWEVLLNCSSSYLTNKLVLPFIRYVHNSISNRLFVISNEPRIITDCKFVYCTWATVKTGVSNNHYKEKVIEINTVTLSGSFE
jgi:hypothetical protein